MPPDTDPDPIEIFGFIVDESDPLGAAIADIIDTPWYVAMFWMSIGMAFVLVVVVVFMFIWYS